MSHNSKMRRGLDMKVPAHELMVRFVYEVNGHEIFGEWVNLLQAYRSWLTPNDEYKQNIKRVEVERVDAVYGGESNATIRWEGQRPETGE